MRWLIIAVGSASLLAAAACDAPTAPELVERIDRVERDLLSDTTAERKLGGRFAGSWDLIRLLPNGKVEPNLQADIDGTEHWFKAFVFERVVVRLDPRDGYPCPLVMRELLAIEGGRQSFMLKGSDFSRPIGTNPYCEQNLHDPGATHGAWPFLWMDRLDNGPRIVGISGNASIDDAGNADKCSFLKIDRSFPFKVDCELRHYAVQLSVGLGISRDDTTHGRISPQRTLRIAYQSLPGLRLVIYCSETRTDIGGCEAMPSRHP
jgi:hypothetical protein